MRIKCNLIMYCVKCWVPQFKKDVKVLECIQRTPGLSSLEKRSLGQHLIVLCSFLRSGGGSSPPAVSWYHPLCPYPSLCKMTMGISFSQPAVSPVLCRRSISVSIPDHVPVFRGPLCVRLSIFSISSILSLILVTLSSLKPLDDSDLTFPLGVLPCHSCLPIRTKFSSPSRPLWCFSATFHAITLRAVFSGPSGYCILQEF